MLVVLTDQWLHTAVRASASLVPRLFRAVRGNEPGYEARPVHVKGDGKGASPVCSNVQAICDMPVRLLQLARPTVPVLCINFVHFV